MPGALAADTRTKHAPSTRKGRRPRWDPLLAPPRTKTCRVRWPRTLGPSMLQAPAKDAGHVGSHRPKTCRVRWPRTLGPSMLQAPAKDAGHVGTHCWPPPRTKTCRVRWPRTLGPSMLQAPAKAAGHRWVPSPPPRTRKARRLRWVPSRGSAGTPTPSFIRPLATLVIPDFEGHTALQADPRTVRHSGRTAGVHSLGKGFVQAEVLDAAAEN